MKTDSNKVSYRKQIARHHLHSSHLVRSPCKIWLLFHILYAHVDGPKDFGDLGPAL